MQRVEAVNRAVLNAGKPDIVGIEADHRFPNKHVQGKRNRANASIVNSHRRFFGKSDQWRLTGNCRPMNVRGQVTEPFRLHHVPQVPL